MYLPAPSKEDIAKMRHLGFEPEDYAGQGFEVWPENWQAFELFCDLRTQWRVGAVGATGLDYNTLFHKMDRMRLAPDEYEELERDIRTMEHEALVTMSERE